jgi:hypothetical protein
MSGPAWLCLGDAMQGLADRRAGVLEPQGQNMRLDQAIQRQAGEDPGPDLVGKRRHAKIDAFAPEPLALAVQWQVLPELVEQDRRQQPRSDEAAWRGVAWRGTAPAAA